MSENTLNQIGVLKRREIEARVLGPFVAELAEAFGRERVIEILRRTIIKLAHTQGAQLAQAMGGNSLQHLRDSMVHWTQDDALEIDVLAHDEERFDFNVTRCRYAEMYRALGIAELGAVLSCNRDFALVETFNADVTLERQDTIMQGAACCTFRYRRNPPQAQP
jgi:predicted ArsR family transcriptional regulator